MIKPDTAAGYSAEKFELARSAALTLATFLGPVRDELVVVGGLVPSLIIDQPMVAHVGTMDLDLGLDLAILDESRYEQLVELLKTSKFVPDETGQGKLATYRWKHSTGITVDFLIAPGSDPKAKTRVISNELSAFQAAALPLAHRDRLEVRLSGKTLEGETAERKLWVCGAAAFVVMKALAFGGPFGRGHPKDAYDLLFVLQNYGATFLTEVVQAFSRIRDDAEARRCIEILRTDFSDIHRLGPVRAAAFVGTRDDIDLRQRHVQTVQEFLAQLEQR
ncbi:MAG: hypothetical protein JNM17_22190 [Archangium sp.]|nr:hypothetical protein [Archangium sp.]